MLHVFMWLLKSWRQVVLCRPLCEVQDVYIPTPQLLSATGAGTGTER
jgi:hypothetical protein